MNNQTLIIFNFKLLFEILKEIESQLNYNIHSIQNLNNLEVLEKNLENYLIISSHKIRGLPNEFIVQKLPLRISKLIERINVQFLKSKYSINSELIIGSYLLNLNSRTLSKNNNKIKLTEKESEMIFYLSKVKKPISVDKLQSIVWRYNIELETHTVETHIYRLRKKIFQIFNDEDFIISTKNGYQINF